MRSYLLLNCVMVRPRPAVVKLFIISQALSTLGFIRSSSSVLHLPSTYSDCMPFGKSFPTPNLKREYSCVPRVSLMPSIPTFAFQAKSAVWYCKVIGNNKKITEWYIFLLKIIVDGLAAKVHKSRGLNQKQRPAFIF